MKWVQGIGPESNYSLTLPESRVILTYHRPRVEPDFITLEVLGSSGISAGVLAADEPDDQDPEPNPDWPLLRSLYTEAHRFVTGWDRTLGDVEKALAGSGPIGLPVEHEAGPPAPSAGTGRPPVPAPQVVRPRRYG